MRIAALFVCMTVMCAVTHAQTTSYPTSATCRMGNLSRTVEVLYRERLGEPPCEVHYKKTTEQPGHDEILWDSEHTSNYCETKMREFVEKLRGMGWDCS